MNWPLLPPMLGEINMLLRGSKAAQLTFDQFPVYGKTADYHCGIQKLFLGCMKKNTTLQQYS